MIAVMIAAATAMFFSLLGTRFLIRYFRRRGAGQPILGKEDRGPEHHMSKQGTPTMGGLAIVGSAGIGWVVAHLRPGIAFATQSLIMWVGVLVLAGMGLLDDVIKVRKRHNRGIFWKKKSYITLGLSVLLAWWLVAATGVSETISFTRASWPGWHVPWPIFVVFAGVMIWSTSNAVNVTDGLDGLAGGSAMMGFFAFTIIAYWAFRNPAVYHSVVNPLDLAVFAAAFACGFGLIAWGGPWLIVVGVLSVLCGLAYTGGPWPLGYHGLGDVFVFVFFGLVAVGPAGASSSHPRVLAITFGPDLEINPDRKSVV